MRFARLVAMVGALIGGYLAVAGAPASAAPLGAASPVIATSGPAEAYMQRRGYRRYYAPRQVYYAPRRSYRRVYRPYRSYRPRYYRPRVVCRIRYTPWGARRVCFRR